MHEEDAGVLWKHVEYRNGHSEVRRQVKKRKGSYCWWLYVATSVIFLHSRPFFPRGQQMLVQPNTPAALQISSPGAQLLLHHSKL
jgi:hypothetical protein